MSTQMEQPGNTAFGMHQLLSSMTGGARTAMGTRALDASTPVTAFTSVGNGDSTAVGTVALGERTTSTRKRTINKALRRAQKDAMHVHRALGALREIEKARPGTLSGNVVRDMSVLEGTSYALQNAAQRALVAGLNS